MTKSIAKLSAQGHSQLEQFGARIKAARLRRNLPQALVAERAGVSIMTYRSAEAGAPGCALGTYMAILEVLGLSADLNLVAKEIPWGAICKTVHSTFGQPRVALHESAHA